MSTRRDLQVKVNSAKGIPSGAFSKPSVHLVLTIDGRTRETLVIKNDCNPSWHHILDFEFEPKEDVGKMDLLVEAYDNGLMGKSKIASALLPLAAYVDGKTHAFSAELTDKKEKPCGEVSLEITLQEALRTPR